MTEDGRAGVRARARGVHGMVTARIDEYGSTAPS
jgi:hypothetical protein